MCAASVRLADDLSLPPAVVTESIGVFGRKGSGKTNTGGLLFEQMFGLGAQCVAIDPVGNWWGLRLARNGKSDGLRIPIFGGDKGDRPITAGGGKLLAQAIVERDISCVIDLMSFRRSERDQFAADFADELFELKKRRHTPLHLFLEEARLFAPETPTSKGQHRLLEAVEQIVRLGRNYGLGISLLDQRPQDVSKTVTGQTEILIVHQMVESQGRESIEKWVRAKKTKGADQLENLAELHTGEAFLWSPGLLRRFAHIHVHKKATYDASKTPEIGGSKYKTPRPLSAKELDKLTAQMAQVMEEAEKNDPTLQLAALRRQLREKEIQLEQAKRVGSPAPAKTVTVEKVIEVPVRDPRLIKMLMGLQNDLGKVLAPIGVSVTKATQLLSRFTTEVEKTPAAKPKALATTAKTTIVAPAAIAAAPRTAPKRLVDANGTVVSKAEKNILRSLAMYEAFGIKQPSATAVGFLAGYSPSGGHFNNTRGAMRTKGLVEYPQQDHLELTEFGRSLAPAIDVPLTNEAMHAAVLGELVGAERKIASALIDAWPNSMTQQEVGEATDLDPDGGHFNNIRGRLRTLGIIDYPKKGEMRAQDFLFPIGR